MPKVKICDIKPKMRDIEVIGQIVRICPKQFIYTKYGFAYLAKATLKDETGSIPVNLWRKQIDIVSEGKKVKIINGFVKVFRNKLELNIGNDGQIIPIEQE
jgi:ssDNA-binding replication factor A large subunit